MGYRNKSKGKRRNKPYFKETDTVETIWASAAYAYRIQGEYVKQVVHPIKESDCGWDYETEGKVPNALLAHYAVQYPDIMKEIDFETGEAMRNHYKGLIFKGLQTQLSDFEKSLLEVVERKDWADPEKVALHFAILCSSARGYVRDLKRQAVVDRLSNCKGGHLGNIRDRLDLTVQVVKSIYSRNYECYFITAVTADENVVFFSYKDGLEQNKYMDIKGTVKAHRDEQQTQLNRVKVIKEY